MVAVAQQISVTNTVGARVETVQAILLRKAGNPMGMTSPVRYPRTTNWYRNQQCHNHIRELSRPNTATADKIYPLIDHQDG